jgi:hypothetical protein
MAYRMQDLYVPWIGASGVWELSHDFIARAVARFLGRRHRYALRRVGFYIAPALLVISLLGGAGVAAWNHFTPDRIRSELADLCVVTVVCERGGRLYDADRSEIVWTADDIRDECS